MKHSRMQELSVAITALIALAIFAMAILVLGGENRLFSKKAYYHALFGDAQGLRVGSPVTMSGVKIGSVEKITLPIDPKSRGIDVLFRVDETYAPRVRQGTKAKLLTLQFVANEKAIDMNPGDPARAPIPEGATIEVETTTELLEQGRSIADALQDITVDLRDILAKMKGKESLIGRAINDPSFGQKGLEEMEAALGSASRLLARAESGDGLLGKMLGDSNYAQTVSADLASAAKSFRAVANRLEAGEGVLGALSKGTDAEGIGGELKEAVQAFRSAADALNFGEGVAGALLKDKQLAGRLTKNLDESLAHLASITRKIDEGTGTLGLLVNDRKLHDDIEQLVTGAKGGTLAGKVIRHYYKKGEKAGDAEKKSGDNSAAGPRN